jgi:putative ABC transport system permease protein
VFLPRDLVITHTTTRQDSQLLISTAPGTGSGSASALVELATRYPGVVVQDRAAFGATARSQQQTSFVVNLIALGVILLYIAIAVSNTLVMTTGERVREFALLRLIGSSRRQVLRMMRLESLVIMVIALVVGSLIPIVPLALLALAFGDDPIPSGPPSVYLAIIAIAAALAYLSTIIPARASLRARPTDAINLRV